MATMGEHGQGTITSYMVTLKSGKVVTRYRTAVTMADGTRVWRRARSEREVRRKRDELVQSRELDLDPTRQTVGAYLHSWIERQRSAKNRRLRARTIQGYEQIIDTHMAPIAGLPLARLSKRRIQTWVDGIDASPQTVRNCHAVLRRALSGAAGDLIPFNPAIGVELPKRAEYQGSPMTPLEVRRLLAAAQGDRLRPLWRLAVITGLRIGELLGLPREALDGDTLTVTTQLQRISGAWVLGPTKSARRLETMELDPETVSIVRAHLRRMSEERQPSWRFYGLMFVTETGEPYHATTILRLFRRLCAEAGIKPRRVHDLRHTSNRLLKDLQIDRETRKNRFGHSTDEMSEHYGGASQALDREAVRRLAEAIA